jgi:hypothetical protein
MSVNIRAAREGDLRQVVELLRLLHKSPDRGPPSAEESGAAQAWKEPAQTRIFAVQSHFPRSLTKALLIPLWRASVGYLLDFLEP